MTDLALDLHFFLDRPIIDQAGLTGGYDFSLRYTTDESASAESNSAPGIFTAFQEQLGLKPEPVKALTDVLTVDHLEKPSAN